MYNYKKKNELNITPFNLRKERISKNKIFLGKTINRKRHNLKVYLNKTNKENTEINNKINYLYSNTIEIQYKKHLEMLIRHKQQFTNDSIDMQVYFIELFSDIVDLIFAFNSYLVGFCILKKIRTIKESSVHQSLGPNKFNNTINSLLLEINKDVFITTDSIEKFRIFEFLFRHSYAHGKIQNLINFLIFSEGSLFIVNNGSKSRLRLLLSSEFFNKYKSDMTSTLTNWYEIRPVPINNSYTSEDYYLLDEESSRSYINVVGHYNLFTSPSQLISFFNNFKSNILKNDGKLIKLSIMNSTDYKIPIHNLCIDYVFIKNYVDSIIKEIKPMIEKGI